MCGIAVILHGSAATTSPFVIDRMTEVLAHRGPDAQATKRLPGCDLGHTRLSIIDLAGGAQPMCDPSGRYWIVFNGEIYNHRDLRRELEAQGILFRTNSDTEALLRGYIRFGGGILSRLNGQFAFAVWDTHLRRLTAARDRFGEKPLYWARTRSDELLIASEIKSILASGLIAPRIDATSVDAYLGLFYVPPDRTIHGNIHVVPPAHEISWDAGQLSQRRYWSPKFGTCKIDGIEAVRETRRLIGNAIDRQSVADVPVGAFLSGGLDSSTIVALMSQRTGHPARTFSVGFDDLINELPFAREVASHYQTEHRELQMDIDVPAMLNRMMDVYDEPFADSSNIPTYLISEAARREVKVVLSGDGGDEVFGGYEWYQSLLTHPSAGSWWERHVGLATGLMFDRQRLWGERRQPPAREAMRAQYSPQRGMNEMDEACWFDQACYLPGDILVKVDRAAMAHGLEIRAPFLDAELSDFVFSLPWQMRFKGPALKGLLRDACVDLWPESIRGRGKQGFGAPVRNWLQQPAVVASWERVTRGDSPLLALLPGVNRVAAELRPQRKWSLLCLGLWLERNSQCLAGLS